MIEANDYGTTLDGKKQKMTYLDPKVFGTRMPLPTRAADGTYRFADHPEFRPNLRCVRVGMGAHACVRASIGDGIGLD